jgi:hypothetical protein
MACQTAEHIRRFRQHDFVTVLQDEPWVMQIITLRFAWEQLDRIMHIIFKILRMVKVILLIQIIIKVIIFIN